MKGCFYSGTTGTFKEDLQVPLKRTKGYLYVKVEISLYQDLYPTFKQPTVLQN